MTKDSPLLCPMGDLVIPIEGAMMKAMEILKRHFLEMHDRIQLGDALATLIVEKQKAISIEKIDAKIAELEKQLLECDGYTSTKNMVGMMIRVCRELKK